MTAPYFQLNDVGYCYPDGTMALSNCTFTIPKNKKIAILGQNGSGKSTLFQLLMGLIPPTHGEIIFEGSPLNYKKTTTSLLRQKVGLIFQEADHQLFASTVEQDVMYGPINLGWPKMKIQQQVEEALQFTELTPLAERPVHFLSGGQKKRATIAGVYAMDPSVFILDEPTSSLDYYFSKQLMKYLDLLLDDNRTFLFATHQINLVYGWADYYIVLHDGKVIYEGNAQGLFSNNDMLQLAHIEKPWLFEVYEELVKDSGVFAPPSNKAELFKLIQEKNIIKNP
ncbi:energy-coupling factor ABC transporter ATP-binding protein [Lysinibacillus yapensis]|uniref:energy-coupling factor ABC transporter ATP-binding protein n=1 Tax=Ureibacillus yapensis TaxID=2304605 RepID=UPI0013142A9E|nr:ABC transporter ATP-binding protein [Lysinibacillus yapensis]